VRRRLGSRTIRSSTRVTTRSNRPRAPRHQTLGGTILVQAQLAANRSKSKAYEQAGSVFPKGLYCDWSGPASPGGASTLAKGTAGAAQGRFAASTPDRGHAGGGRF
jgi:hypothetical protein